MADGRWVMTENELNSVVSGFKETDTVALPNEGKHLPVDVRGGSGDACNREMGYNEVCAFCGSDKMRWDLVNTAKALAAARPSARTAEVLRTSCTRMKWGSFLGRRENANQVKGQALLTLMALRHIIGMITNTDLLKSWMKKVLFYIITII